MNDDASAAVTAAFHDEWGKVVATLGTWTARYAVARPTVDGLREGLLRALLRPYPAR